MFGSLDIVYFVLLLCRSQPDVLASLLVLQQVRIIPDGLDHPRFHELTGELGVEGFAEIT